MNTLKIVCAAVFVSACGAAVAAQDPLTPATETSRQQRMDDALNDYRDGQNAHPGVGQRTEDSVKRGVHKTGNAIERGAKAVGHAIGTGLDKTGDALRRGGDKLQGKSEN